MMGGEKLDKFTKEMLSWIRNIDSDAAEIAECAISNIADATDEDVSRIVAGAIGLCLIEYTIKEGLTSTESLFDKIGVVVAGGGITLGIVKAHATHKALVSAHGVPGDK